MAVSNASRVTSSLTSMILPCSSIEMDKIMKLMQSFTWLPLFVLWLQLSNWQRTHPVRIRQRVLSSGIAQVFLGDYILEMFEAGMKPF
jgi:hypothetical protein